MWEKGCPCLTTTSLRGSDAFDFARFHLRQVPRSFELRAGSIADEWGEWECPDTGTRWHHTTVSPKDVLLLRYPLIAMGDLRDESSWTARAAALEPEDTARKDRRGNPEPAEEDWAQYSRWFEAFHAMYPRSWTHYVTDLLLAETDALAAIAFLRADPWCLHSGYWKMKVSVAVTRVPLDTEQLDTLRDVVLATVANGRRCEFPQTALLAKRIWDDRIETAAVAMRQSGDTWLEHAGTLLIKKRYTN